MEELEVFPERKLKGAVKGQLLVLVTIHSAEKKEEGYELYRMINVLPGGNRKRLFYVSILPLFL